MLKIETVGKKVQFSTWKLKAHWNREKKKNRQGQNPSDLGDDMKQTHTYRLTPSWNPKSDSKEVF